MSETLRAQHEHAALNVDWMQVVLNGGPPCFHLEGDRFCLRAERWDGHGAIHEFVPLVAAFATARAEAQADARRF